MTTDMWLSQSSQELMKKERPVCIIGAEASDNRVQGFQDALRKLALPQASVVSYHEIIKNGPGILDDLPKRSILRIDSPGRRFDLYKQFLRNGYSSAAEESSPCIDPSSLDGFQEDKGRILYTRQWYLGFCKVLNDIQGLLQERRDITPLQSMTDIQLMFDKARTHQRLVENNIPTPVIIENITAYDELWNILRRNGGDRVFVKSRHGSSASGVVAYQTRGNRHLAVSTVEMVRTGSGVTLYNSRKLHRYEKAEDIKVLIDRLSADHVHVETWFPKVGLNGKTCDCRILMIAGEPAHAIVRAGRGPITNLHLGCERISAQKLRDVLGDDSWVKGMETCGQAAKCFPKCLYMGIDLAFSPNGQRHAVLEVNAFGDLLKNITHRGLTSYEAEVKAMPGFIGRAKPYKALLLDLDGTLIPPQGNCTRANRRLQLEMIPRVRPAPGTFEMLSRLRKNYRLVLVSNGSEHVQRAKLKAAGLEELFVGIVISGSIGGKKPKRLIFEKGLAAAGCLPQDALFVGDDPLCDIAGAKAAGMRTCWIGEAKDYPLHINHPDLIISSILELPGVLS